ncbi:MAG: hypothetical protein LBT18_05975, partial [Endomicrobium sp.]|nr:hypothetical protein [Endomicrobium sp.]
MNRLVNEKEKLKLLLTATVLWVKQFNATKILVLFIVNCFLLSFVYGQAVALVAENIRSTEQFKQIFSDFTLPYSYGKITSSNFTGSDTVIINIQDLHLHPQVQKNIGNIIQTFDKEYGVKNVYLEGAYGQVDTSWLANINNKKTKEETINTIFETGILTGAEYYSAISNRTELIKGLENKEPYLQNLKRFGDILYFQNEVSTILASMDENIKYLKSMYFNHKQHKIEELVKNYTLEKIDANKYFILMSKYTDTLGIDINNYENIAMYIDLLNESKKIDYNRATKELQIFIMKLRELLPYAAYEMIVKATSNFGDIDKLYTYLLRLSRENNIDLSVNFPELNKFFGYIELSQKINPLEMIKEEGRLINEINTAFSTDQGERDVVFLSGFSKYLKDYLSSKITSDDYKYYKANVKKFKKLWVKYIDNKKLAMLKSYEATADKFYDINVDRNQYFIDNIDSIKNTGKIEVNYKDNLSETEKVIKSLRQAKNVSVVVTGGFHTGSVSELLEKQGISYIVITPNVSGGVEIAQEAYYALAKEQSKILFQTLAALNISQLKPGQQILEISEILAKRGCTIEKLNEYLHEILKEGVTAVISGDIKDLSSVKLSITEDGKAAEYSYTDAAFVKTTQEAPAVETVSSEKSVRSAVKTAIASFSVAAALITSIIISLIFGGPIFGPVIAVIFSLLSAYLIGLGAYESYQANLMAKADLSSSDVSEGISDVDTFKKMIGALPEDAGRQFTALALGIPLEEVDAILAKENEKELARLISERKIMSEEGVVAMSSHTGAIKINYSLIRAKFFDESGHNIKSQKLLEVWVRHELRHQYFSSASNKIANWIHRRAPLLEELLVSFVDLFSWIIITVQNWFAKGIRTVTAKQQKASLDLAKKDIEAAFREVQVSRYREVGRYGEQTNKQIEAALKVAELDKVVELGTGGGKSDMGQLAMAMILINEAISGRNAGILYSSARENLNVRDLVELSKFLNNPEIFRVLKDYGVQTQIINGREIIVVGHILPGTENAVLYDGDGEEITSFTDVDGKEVKVTKTWLYKNGLVVGADKSTLVWDYEEAMFAPKNFGQTAMQRIGVFDEAHTLLNDLRQKFIQSSGQIKKAGQVALQKIADNYVNTLIEDTDYIIEQQNATLTQEGRRKVESDFTQEGLNISQQEWAQFSGFTADEWSQCVTWALTARQYRAGKEYTLNNRVGKVFEVKSASGSKQATIVIEALKEKRDKKTDLTAIITTPAGTYSIELKDVVFDDFTTGELLKAAIANVQSEFTDSAFGKPLERNYVDIIGQETGEVSASSRWAGLHTAIEIHLENTNRANFQGMYSQDTRISSKYSLIDWMNTLVGVAGYTGTMPGHFFNRTLSKVFKGGLSRVESGAVAKPSIARAKLFESNDARMTAVISDIFDTRAALEETKGRNPSINSNGLAVFSSISELKKAEGFIKGHATRAGVDPDLIITIDGERDTFEDITRKINDIKRAKNNDSLTGFIILATNIVSIGVDAPLSYVFNAMAEKQDVAARKQLRDRAGRSGNQGFTREYYSIEEIAETDQTRDLIAKLKRSYSKTSEDRLIDQGNLDLKRADELQEDEAVEYKRIGETYKTIFEGLLAKKDTAEIFLSNSGHRTIDAITAMQEESIIESAERTVNEASRESEILEQFAAQARMFAQGSSAWQREYFGKILQEEDYRQIGFNLGFDYDTAVAKGMEQVEYVRKLTYDRIIAIKDLYLSAEEEINAQIDAKFASSVTSFLYGAVEITAGTEKIASKYKLFYGAASKVAANAIKENLLKPAATLQGSEIEESKTGSISQETVEEPNKHVQLLLKNVSKANNRNSILRGFNKIVSVLMRFLGKIIPIGIPILVGGGLLGLVLTMLLAPGAAPILIAIAGFLAKIAIPIAGFGGVIGALPIWGIVLIVVALVAVLVLLNGFVKKITAAISERDNENIEEYSASGKGFIAAGSANINKTLAMLAKSGIYTSFVAIVAGFLIPGLGIAFIATGILLAIVGIAAALLLMAKNLKVLRNKKVAADTSKDNIGKNIATGLMMGAGGIIPIFLMHFSVISFFIALAIIAVLFLVRYVSDKITGNQSTLFQLKTFAWVGGSLVVGGGIVAALATGVITIGASIVSIISGGLLLALAILAVVAVGLYIYNKNKADRSTVQEYVKATQEPSLSDKYPVLKTVKNVFLGLTATAIPLIFSVLMLYISGFFSLALVPMLIAVGIGLAVAAAILFGLRREKTKQFAMAAIEAAGVVMVVMNRIGSLSQAMPVAAATTQASQDSQQQEPSAASPMSVAVPLAVDAAMASPMLQAVPASFRTASMLSGSVVQSSDDIIIDRYIQLLESYGYTVTLNTDINGNQYLAIEINGSIHRIYLYKEDGTLISQDEFDSAVKSMQLAVLKASNDITKNAIDQYDEKGNLYWEINGYKIYPFDKDGNLITADKLAKAIQYAPIFNSFKSFLVGQGVVLDDVAISAILFDSSGNLRSNIEWDGSKINNAETLLKNYQIFQSFKQYLTDHNINLSDEEIGLILFNKNGLRNTVKLDANNQVTNAGELLNNYRALNAVLDVLKAAGYEVSLKYEGDDDVPVLTITKYGLTLDVYPFDDKGNFTFDITKIEKIFSAYKELTDNGYKVEVKYDGKGYIYFEVTLHGATLTIYPFDDKGNFTYSIENVRDVFNARVDAGYQIFWLLVATFGLFIIIYPIYKLIEWLRKSKEKKKVSVGNADDIASIIRETVYDYYTVLEGGRLEDVVRYEGFVRDIAQKIQLFRILNPQIAISEDVLKMFGVRADLADKLAEIIAKTEMSPQEVQAYKFDLLRGRIKNGDPQQDIINSLISSGYPNAIAVARAVEVLGLDAGSLVDIIKNIDKEAKDYEKNISTYMWDKLKKALINKMEQEAIDKLKRGGNLDTVLTWALSKEAWGLPTDSIMVLRRMEALGIINTLDVKTILDAHPNFTYPELFDEIIYQKVVLAEYDKIKDFLPETWNGDTKEFATGENVRERMLKDLAISIRASLVRDPLKLTAKGVDGKLDINVTQPKGPIQTSPLTLREGIIYTLLQMNPSSTANPHIAKIRAALKGGKYDAALIELDALKDINPELVAKLRQALKDGNNNVANDVLTNLEALGYSLGGAQAIDWPMTTYLMTMINRAIDDEAAAEITRAYRIYMIEYGSAADDGNGDGMRAAESKYNSVIAAKKSARSKITSQIQAMRKVLELKADMLTEIKTEITQNKFERNELDSLATRMTDEKWRYFFALLLSDFEGKILIKDGESLREETDAEYAARISTRKYVKINLYDISKEDLQRLFPHLAKALGIAFDVSGKPVVLPKNMIDKGILAATGRVNLMLALAVYYDDIKAQKATMNEAQKQQFDRRTILQLSEATNSDYLQLSTKLREDNDDIDYSGDYRSLEERMNDLAKGSGSRIWNAVKSAFGSFFGKFFSFELWGIKTPEQKIKTMLLTLLFVALAMTFFISYFFIPLQLFTGTVGVALMVFKNMTFTLGGMFLSAATMIPKMIFGHAEDAGMKGSYIKLSTIFSVLWGGILGGLFTRGLPLAMGYILAGGFGAFGAVITVIIGLAIWLFTGPSTFFALNDFMIAQRGQDARNKENQSEEYQSKVTKIKTQTASVAVMALAAVAAWALKGVVFTFLGLPSWGLILLVGAIIAAIIMIGAYIRSWYKDGFNKSDMVLLVGALSVFLGVPAILIWGLPLLAALPLAGSFFVVVGFLMVVCGLIYGMYRLYNYLKGTDNIAAKRYKVAYKQFLEKEKYRLLIEGSTVRGYLERTLQEMHNAGLITDKELESWMGALADPNAKEFVEFGDSEANKTMDSVFETIGLYKPLLGSKYAIASASTVLQTGKEVTNVSIDRLLLPDTGDKKGTLLGKYAKAQKSRWQEVMRKINDVRIRGAVNIIFAAYSKT